MRTFGVAQVCLILIATCFPFFLPGEERKEGRKGGREEGGEVAQLCMTLGDPVDCNLPGSSVHGLSRQKYWSGLPFPSPGDFPDPWIEPVSLAAAGGFFTTAATCEVNIDQCFLNLEVDHN